MSDLRNEKSLGLSLVLEIKSLALVLVLKIIKVLVLTTKSYLHHWYLPLLLPMTDGVMLSVCSTGLKSCRESVALQKH